MLVVVAALRLGAPDLKARNYLGETLLDWALGKNAYQNVAFLHAHGVRWRERSDPELPPLRYAAREGQAEMVRELLACGIWDPEAMQLAESPAVKALLEDAGGKHGSRVIDDLQLWPVICADTVNWRRRVEAHLANGGNVNFVKDKAYGDGVTPLEMALKAMNPELVRLLLERGAIPRARRGAHPSVKPPSIYCLIPPYWVVKPGVPKPPHAQPFPATIESWDAYAADMITLIAPNWPDPCYPDLVKTFHTIHMPRAAAALQSSL